MYYSYIIQKGRSPIVAVGVDRVKEILKLNKSGENPEDLFPQKDYAEMAKEEDITFAADEMTDVVQLPDVKRRRGRNKKRSSRKPGSKRGPRKPEAKTDGTTTKSKPKGNRNNRNKNQNKNKPGGPKAGGNKPNASKRNSGKPNSQKSNSNRPNSNKKDNNTNKNN